MGIDVNLFDVSATDSKRRARHTEGSYEYLALSGRPEAADAREILSTLFSGSGLTGPDRTHFLTRFRDTNDYQHWEALFELVTQGLLRAHGYDVEYERAVVPHADKTPDFLARKNDDTLHVECTTDRNDYPARDGHGNVTAICDYLERSLPKLPYTVHLSFQAVPSETPKLRHVSGQIGRWMKSLDHAETRAAFVDGRVEDALKEFIVDDSNAGLRLLVRLDPLPAATEPTERVRVLTVVSRKPEDTTPESMYSSLKKKVGRYGRFQTPYLIALNVYDWTIRNIDVGAALFGAAGYTTDAAFDDAPERRFTRGLWRGRNGPSNQEVSGVIVVRHLTAWNLDRREATLWHNPFAERALVRDLWRGPQMVPDDEQRMIEKSGDTVGQLLREYVQTPSPSHD